MLCLLLSGAGMASSCRKYSSTWTCRAEQEGTAAQRRGLSSRAQGLATEGPPGDTSPSQQEIWLPLKDGQVGRALRNPTKVQRKKQWPGSSPLLPVSWPWTSPSPNLRHPSCTTRWEPPAGCRRGQTEATCVRPGGNSHRTWDMTSRDQLSVMEMGWLGLAGSLLSLSEGRSSVGPNTVARLCRDILFTVSFSATLWRAEAEEWVLL